MLRFIGCRLSKNYLARQVRYASTVYALSSGHGKCGVAVIRVTGDKAKDVISHMTVPPTLPYPRKATLRRIVHSITGEGLDRSLVLWFPGPNSFTGEDCCELQVHGGVAVVSAILSSLSSIHGLQPAKPGDFTKRAFYNGKLDLTSVEGLGDLIHAETEAQRKQAFRQMEGALAQLYSRWRESILFCRANLEAYIDFSEDENIEEGVIKEVETSLKKMTEEMKTHLADERRGERLRSGLHLAIIGRPNTGKSSLLNVLTQRPAAIVSPIPGTTRDIVETSLDLGGYPVIISDTAGLRKTDDIIETEGIQRAVMRAKQADVVVILLEASELLLEVKQENFDWERYVDRLLSDTGIHIKSITNSENECEWVSKKNYILFINKVDLIESKKDMEILSNIINNKCCLASIKTQEGLASSLNKLKDLCASLCETGTEGSPILTSARHRTHISSSLDSLSKIFGNEMADNEDYDLICNNLLQSEETLLLAAHHLQKAATSLGQVTGHVTTEDVLDHIFSAFCIGK